MAWNRVQWPSAVNTATTSSFIQDEELLDQLRDFQFLLKDTAAWCQSMDREKGSSSYVNI
jgi:hypothetical protein